MSEFEEIMNEIDIKAQELSADEYKDLLEEVAGEISNCLECIEEEGK